MQLLESVKESLGFDGEDVERLQRLRPELESHFPEIIDRLVEALDTNGHAEPLLEQGQEKRRLRKAFQIWLEKTFAGEIDESYSELQREIGETYHACDVDPEHMLGAMNVVRTELITSLLDRDLELPLEEALVTLDRVLDLNMSLILDAYWKSLVDEKNDVGSKLASSMAHEIRNPLNAVELHLTLLQRQLADTYDDPDDYQPMLEAVRSELQRIETLTTDIQQFARRVSVHPDWHDLHEMIDELESTHAGLFEATDIEFTTDLEGAERIYCDASQLKQVLVHLLQNAVESIHGDGEIGLHAETNASHTTITISDTGEGLESGSSQRIFELFYTTKPSSTGLGLPVTKRIVEGHGGVIDLRANDDGGTSVDVTLPHPSDDSEKEGTGS